MGHSHSIYVFGSEEFHADQWRLGIYEKIKHYISHGYAVVYVAEEEEAETIQHFSSLGMPIEDHVQAGSLTIVNRDVFYSPFIPCNVLLEQWNKLFANIQKKGASVTYRGFVAIGMPADSFFMSELDTQQLVKYESAAAENYDGSIEAMCLYSSEMIQSMHLGHLVSLLNAHQNTAHRNGELRQWNSRRALILIKRGFDAALGNNVSEMVLSMILRDFGTNEDALISHPDQFEKKLQIILGESGADIAIDCIKDEIKKDIVY